MSGKKLKFMIGGLVVVLAVGTLVYFAIKGNMVYYYTVEELTAKGPSQNVRVAGDLVNGTLEKGGVGEPIRFEIYDKNAPDRTLFIKYTGAVPDTFKDDPANPVEVVVEGDYLNDGSFDANFLLAKCPSKYEKALDEKSAQSSASGQ
ncbi:MAG: cytochrome c maturation protein CcmE [Thermoleophilia bacterium]|nr:cytochrome c maturation protein CcmE [Thermoleophilia bacterium]